MTKQTTIVVTDAFRVKSSYIAYAQSIQVEEFNRHKGLILQKQFLCLAQENKKHEPNVHPAFVMNSATSLELSTHKYWI